MKPQHIAAIVVALLVCGTALFIYFDYSSRSNQSLPTETSYAASSVTKKKKPRVNPELAAIQKQIDNPGQYIDVEYLDYKLKLFKTNELKLRLTNNTKFVWYDNIEVQLELHNKNKTFTQKAFFKGRLAPLEDANFSMYLNGMLGAKGGKVQVLSANAIVAPSKAEELGIE